MEKGPWDNIIKGTKKRTCLAIPEFETLADYRAAWLEQNDCDPDTARGFGPGCKIWSCETAPFASCTSNGGAIWPDDDFNRCKRRASKFDYGAAIWRFFSEVAPAHDENSSDQP